MILSNMYNTNMSQKPLLKLHFTSVWPNFNPKVMPQDYFFEYVLSKSYNIVYDSVNPDIVIYSHFGPVPNTNDFSPQTLFVAYTGEPQDITSPADVYFGFHDSLMHNYYRLPIWVMWIHWDTQNWTYKLCNEPTVGQGSHHVFTQTHDNTNSITHPMRLSNILQKHTSNQIGEKFCNFTYSRSSKERVEFFLKLNTKLKVDSTGGLFNNTGYKIANKSTELKKWKFTLAFENTKMSGYVTEKLLEPLAAGSIPIYWGGSQAKNDFNNKRFIFVDDFSSYDECIDWILHVNQSPALLTQYLEQPVFNTLPDWPDKVFDCLYHKMVAKNYKMRI